MSEMSEPTDTTAVTEALARMQQVPFLADFARPLPRLGDAGGDDVRSTFMRFGDLLGRLDEPVVVVFRLTDGGAPESWSVSAGPEGAQVGAEAAGTPDLEAILSRRTWQRMAGGELSPLEAFGRGELRVRGDVTIARTVVRRLRRGLDD
jgi:SCP-2 sterol transfer family